MSDPGYSNPFATGPDSDYIEPPANQNDQSIHPDLKQFRDLPWPDEAQPWAEEAATRVNDYVQRQQLGADNARAAQVYRGNIAAFGNGLVSRTAADPHFADTAISLVRPTIGALVDTHPTHPEEDRGGHFEDLSSDLENQIAMAGIKGMAERHGPTARSWLDGDLGGYLDDNQKSFLSSYIGAQDLARGADAVAGQRMRAQAMQAQSATASLGHAAQLYDPQTDSVRFPAGWAQRLTANPSVAWPDKGALMHLYGRLQSGDAPASDPYQINNALQTVARGGSLVHSDLINSAGTSLRLADALHLAPASAPLSPQQRAHYANLADVVQQARDALFGRDGENGAAGSRAWGRYVNWLLPAVRQGMTGFNDPDTHPLNSVGRFAPSGDDLIEPRAATAPTKSLGEIFGR